MLLELVDASRTHRNVALSQRPRRTRNTMKETVICPDFRPHGMYDIVNAALLGRVTAAKKRPDAHWEKRRPGDAQGDVNLTIYSLAEQLGRGGI